LFSVPNSKSARIPMLCGVDEHATTHPVADHLHDFAVTHLRKAAPAGLRRAVMPSTPIPRQTVDDVTRDVGVTVEADESTCSVMKRRTSSTAWFTLACSAAPNSGLGKEEPRIEVSEEEALGKAERLRPGKEHSSACRFAAQTVRRSKACCRLREDVHGCSPRLQNHAPLAA